MLQKNANAITSRRDAYFAKHLQDLLDAEGCPVCRESVAAELDYLSYLLVETYREPDTQHAIAAALGFCNLHGAWLSQQADKCIQITSLKLTLTENILGLLRSSAAARARQVHSRFASADCCPACAIGQQTAARRILGFSTLLAEPAEAARYGKPALFCQAHFQVLLPCLPVSARERLLAIQEDALERARNSLIAAESSAATGELSPTLATRMKAIQASLVAAAGHDRDADFSPRSDAKLPALDPRSLLDGFAADLGHDDICPLCLQLQRAFHEWIVLAGAACKQDQLKHDTPSLCAKHVWAVVRLMDPAPAIMIVQNVIDQALQQIRTARNAIAPAFCVKPRSLRECLRTRLESSADPPAEASEALVGSIPCSACQHQSAAEDQAIELLFALLETNDHRADLESGYGLCLKHFHQALRRAPSPLMQHLLLDCASASLACLRWELEEASRKWTFPARAETKGMEQMAWQRAVKRFSGWMETASR